MSNETSLPGVPAHIADRIRANREAGKTTDATLEALLGSALPPHISTRGSRYRLVEGSHETVFGTEMDVIIVGSNPGISKIWFEGTYDPSEKSPPSCWSSDGKSPDSTVANPVSESCLKCPKNVLGSKVNPNTGNKTKECSDIRYLAVVPAADPTKVYRLTVPVTAMKGLRTYAGELASFGLEAHWVVTKLGFDDNASYPLPTFHRGKYLPEKGIELAEKAMLNYSSEIGIAICTEEQLASLPAPKTGNGKVAHIENARAQAEEKAAAEARAQAEEKAAAEAKKRAAAEARAQAEEKAAAEAKKRAAAEAKKRAAAEAKKQAEEKAAAEARAQAEEKAAAEAPEAQAEESEAEDTSEEISKEDALAAALSSLFAE
jgi:hypothetical protein